jgi:hypothetical protein
MIVVIAAFAGSGKEAPCARELVDAQVDPHQGSPPDLQARAKRLVTLVMAAERPIVQLGIIGGHHAGVGDSSTSASIGVPPTAMTAEMEATKGACA